MSTTTERVLKMIATGEVTAEQGAELMRAMETTKKPSPVRWLFAPFDTLSTRSGLIVTLLCVVAGLGLATQGVRFDGALDAHVGSGGVALPLALVHQAVALGLTAVVFWGVTYAFTRVGRFVDYLLVVGVARLPFVLMGAATLLLAPDAAALRDNPLQPRVFLLAAVALPCLAWAIVLMVNGVRTASNARGGKLALSVVVSLIVAETLSKLVLFAI